MISFQQKKVKPFHKYCPAGIGAAFSPNFALGAKMQNSAFLNISC